MSDITKKIFSIEPDMDDVVRPVLDDGLSMPKPSPEKLDMPAPKLRGARPVIPAPDVPAKQPPAAAPLNDAPEFISRAPAQPIHAPSITLDDIEGASGWITATLVMFGLVWLLGAAIAGYLYFAAGGASPLALTGFILSLLLPAALLACLWVALKRLNVMKNQSAALIRAAQALAEPDKDALRATRSLAQGVRAEMDSVDARLAQTTQSLQAIQLDLTRESQGLEKANLALSTRADDVGRSLTLQRQALESVAGTFDSRMETLKANISDQSEKLNFTLKEAGEVVQVAASGMEDITTKVASASTSAQSALSGGTEKMTQMDQRLGELLAGLEAMSEKFETRSAQVDTMLTAQSSALEQQSKALQNATLGALNDIDSLSDTYDAGAQKLGDLTEQTRNLRAAVEGQFEDMGATLDQTREKTQMVVSEAASQAEDSLDLTRRQLSKLEVQMQALQARLATSTDRLSELELGTPDHPEKSGAGRLNLMPLETDFPPVEPPRAPEPRKTRADSLPDKPLNLGADMQIENPDDALTAFEPDAVRRIAPETKGFGRSKAKDKERNWRWRDMLGGLEPPDAEAPEDIPIPTPQTVAPALAAAPLAAPSIPYTELDPPQSAPLAQISGWDGSETVAWLCRNDLAPSAIVDEGTIIEASKAHVASGQSGLSGTVERRLSQAIAHFRDCLRADPEAAANIPNFVARYDAELTRNPKNSAELRALFGAADGRAYLICAAGL